MIEIQYFLDGLVGKVEKKDKKSWKITEGKNKRLDLENQFRNVVNKRSRGEKKLAKKIKDEINIKNHKQFPRTDGYLFSNWQGPSKRLASMHINRIL